MGEGADFGVTVGEAHPSLTGRGYEVQPAAVGGEFGALEGARPGGGEDLAALAAHGVPEGAAAQGDPAEEGVWGEGEFGHEDGALDAGEAGEEGPEEDEGPEGLDEGGEGAGRGGGGQRSASSVREEATAL